MASYAIRRLHYVQQYRIGAATISGVVRKLTVPLANCPVYLLDQDGFLPIRKTISASDGAYSFTNMEQGTEYIVVAIDPGGAYNAVLADRVTA